MAADHILDRSGGVLVGRRQVGWADVKNFERAIDAIVFGALVAVAVGTKSDLIRMVTAASASFLPVGWFVA